MAYERTFTAGGETVSVVVGDNEMSVGVYREVVVTRKATGGYRFLKTLRERVRVSVARWVGADAAAMGRAVVLAETCDAAVLADWCDDATPAEGTFAHGELLRAAI